LGTLLNVAVSGWWISYEDSKGTAHYRINGSSNYSTLDGLIGLSMVNGSSIVNDILFKTHDEGMTYEKMADFIVANKKRILAGE